MPVIKSAKKKLRKDIKREKRNDVLRVALKSALKDFKKTPSEKSLSQATKALDKAAKNHIIHKSKASRLKSSLSKLIAKKSQKISAPAKK